MARVNVIMPQMGESIAEGTVSRWLRQVGDEVKRDEAILEISTDKVDAEIPSPASGVLVEIKVQEGETVEVQTVVAVLETEKARQRHGGDCRRAPAAPVHPAGATHRCRACRRHKPRGGQRARGSRDQKGHPGIHRERRAQGGPRGPGTPPGRAGPGGSPGSGGASSCRGLARGRGRADESHSQAHGRPHGHVPARVGSRDQLLRGGLHQDRGHPAATQGRIRRARRQPDVPRLHHQGDRRQSPQAPGGQRLGERRHHRLSEGSQHRHRGGPRLGAHRTRAKGRRRALLAGHREADGGPGRACPHQAVEPRRGPAGDLHHHQPRRVRVLQRRSDHQSAAGGDPGNRRHREASQGHHAGRRAGRHRDPDDGAAVTVLRSPDRGNEGAT